MSALAEGPVLETERLILRPPEERDLPGFYALMRDPVAAEHIGGVMDEAQTWRSFCALVGHWRLRGYGFFSVEERRTGAWIGRIGPWFPHLWPAPEVGWSILREHWGKGYAPEAGAACVDYAFDTLGWDRVIHCIAPANANSKAVARKLGSRFDGEHATLAGLGPGIEVEIWGQDRADWNARRSRVLRAG
ncbi:MAG: GNAT family N-acetyltransferase [Oceanicaulis sp.]